MNKPSEPAVPQIADVQGSPDTRQLDIDRVGIKGIRHPVRILARSGADQHTVANFNMYVHLPHNFKGTHMSRFVEILNSHEREISLGSFVMFNTYMGMLIWPMIAIGWVANLAQRGTASLTRLRDIMDVVPAIRDEPPLVEMPEVRGALRARNLSFAWPSGEPALTDLSFDVAAGQTVALVGRTGSGKSSLLSLLPRLLDPPEGTLFLDGVDVRRIPLATLRRAIGMVPQETFLFSATLSDNITLGRPEATREEALEAARIAGLETDLAAFPQGLDTLVGERGITLSGGQKQRVAIARALLRDPRILLLDDSLSAVDTHTEEQILRNLRTVFEGRTVFLVSHRISTVQNADLILVLDRGRVAERGTHQQLLAHGGLYADLHQRQLLEEELAAV